jgi:hypothetical protein
MHKNCAIQKVQAKTYFSVLPVLFFAIAIVVLLLIIAFVVVIPDKVHGLGMVLFKGELAQVLAPRTGTIISWRKEEGDAIRVGEKLATMIDHQTDEAIEIFATVEGVIAEIIVFGNSFVDRGETIAIISHHGDPRQDLELTGFVSSFDGKKIAPGMRVLINPTITKPYSQGYLIATVKRVGKLPVTRNAILSILKSAEVADFIREQIHAEPFMVVIEPAKDQGHVTGYQWTGPGPKSALDSGIFADFTIIVDEERLLSMLLPRNIWPQREE